MIVIITEMMIIIAKNKAITGHISKDSNIASGISFSVDGHNSFYWHSDCYILRGG
jgi:hypothetical protein